MEGRPPDPGSTEGKNRDLSRFVSPTESSSLRSHSSSGRSQESFLDPPPQLSPLSPSPSLNLSSPSFPSFPPVLPSYLSSFLNSSFSTLPTSTPLPPISPHHLSYLPTLFYRSSIFLRLHPPTSTSSSSGPFRDDLSVTSTRRDLSGNLHDLAFPQRHPCLDEGKKKQGRRPKSSVHRGKLRAPVRLG